MQPYGSISLTTTSPAQDFTEPITLVEMKEYLNLPARSPVNEEEDSLISDLISAARVRAERETGIDLVRKQWDKSLDYFLEPEIECRDPLVSVDLVRYRSSDGSYTNLVDGTDYVVDTAKHPGLIMPAYNTTWPSFTAWPSSAVLVRFTSGYAATDAFWNDDGKYIMRGMKLFISASFTNRMDEETEAAIGRLFRLGRRLSVH